MSSQGPSPALETEASGRIDVEMSQIEEGTKSSTVNKTSGKDNSSVTDASISDNLAAELFKINDVTHNYESMRHESCAEVSGHLAEALDSIFTAMTGPAGIPKMLHHAMRDLVMLEEDLRQIGYRLSELSAIETTHAISTDRLKAQKDNLKQKKVELKRQGLIKVNLNKQSKMKAEMLVEEITRELEETTYTIEEVEKLMELDD